jgi:hypothetical protein
MLFWLFTLIPAIALFIGLLCYLFCAKEEYGMLFVVLFWVSLPFCLANGICAVGCGVLFPHPEDDIAATYVRVVPCELVHHNVIVGRPTITIFNASGEEVFHKGYYPAVLKVYREQESLKQQAEESARLKKIRTALDVQM